MKKRRWHTHGFPLQKRTPALGTAVLFPDLARTPRPGSDLLLQLLRGEASETPLMVTLGRLGARGSHGLSCSGGGGSATRKMGRLYRANQCIFQGFAVTAPCTYARSYRHIHPQGLPTTFLSPHRRNCPADRGTGRTFLCISTSQPGMPASHMRTCVHDANIISCCLLWRSRFRFTENSSHANILWIRARSNINHKPVHHVSFA